MQRPKIVIIFIVLISVCWILSCSKDSPTKSSDDTISFSVDGFWVTIYNMWRDGSTQRENLQGLVSFDQTISRNNETHTLEWRNIVCNYTLMTVTSFNVNIDGEDYSYPEDGEPVESEYKIEFDLNGQAYTYQSAFGQRNHPFGVYLTAGRSRAEQYIIYGSQTVQDGQQNKNTIIIGFVNWNGWRLEVLYLDTQGNQIPFNSTAIDISVLKNRDQVGGKMTASISGPIQSVDGTKTLTHISLSAERLESIVTEPDEFLTHNTGSLKVSVFENGNIGHLGCNTTVGEGVRYNGYGDAIFAAGLIIGTDSRRSVNGQLGSFSIVDDFVNIETITGFQSDPPDWDQIASAKFDDSGAPTPYDITIHQTSYSKYGAEVVFLQYALFGSGATYDDLFVGLFADWDVGDSFQNLGGYDASRNMAYQYCSNQNADPNYYGIIALHDMAGARVTDQGTNISIRDSSFTWISTFLDEDITAPGDYRTWIGAGPLTLAVHDTITVYFAITAGTDLDNLKSNADDVIADFNRLFGD